MMWEDLHQASARAREEIKKTDQILRVLRKQQADEIAKAVVHRAARRVFKVDSEVREHFESEQRVNAMLDKAHKEVIRRDPVTGDPRERAFGPKEAFRVYDWPKLKEIGDSWTRRWDHKVDPPIHQSVLKSGREWFLRRGWEVEFDYIYDNSYLTVMLIEKKKYNPQEKDND